MCIRDRAQRGLEALAEGDFVLRVDRVLHVVERRIALFEVRAAVSYTHLDVYKRQVCGYVHEGAAAPDTCPVCGAPASEFTELKGKKGLFGDTNSNAYICLLYTSRCV